jgi:hypothetical protein
MEERNAGPGETTCVARWAAVATGATTWAAAPGAAATQAASDKARADALQQLFMGVSS